jgi:hypothetical protein
MLPAQGVATVPDTVHARVRTEVIDVPPRLLFSAQVARDPGAQASRTQSAPGVYVVSGLKPHRAELSDPDFPLRRAEKNESVGSWVSRQMSYRGALGGIHANEAYIRTEAPDGVDCRPRSPAPSMSSWSLGNMCGSCKPERWVRTAPRRTFARSGGTPHVSQWHTGRVSRGGMIGLCALIRCPATSISRQALKT